MPNITASVGDPISIVVKSTNSPQEGIIAEFTAVLHKLYQFELLKNILDLMVTVVLEGRLQFIVYDQKKFDLDQGNCKTIESGKDNLFNKLRSRKTFTITIKKVHPAVVMHEIAHMVEKNLALDLNQSFAQAVMLDIEATKGRGNIRFKETVKSLLLDQVALYPKSHHMSELFARYYELVALSHEISGKYAASGFGINNVLAGLANTEKWLQEHVYKGIDNHTNSLISSASKRYIKPIAEVQHNWSEERVQSFHNRSSKKKWGKAVTSIFDEK